MNDKQRSTLQQIADNPGYRVAVRLTDGTYEYVPDSVTKRIDKLDSVSARWAEVSRLALDFAKKKKQVALIYQISPSWQVGSYTKVGEVSLDGDVWDSRPDWYK